MLKSVSTSMLWRGAFAVVIGVISIVWPEVTVGALVLLFAIYAFSDAIGQFARAFAGGSGGSVVGHSLLGLLDLVAGVVAIAWPGITVYVLTIWVGVWAVVTGVMEIGTAFMVPAGGGIKAFLGFSGVISVLFGIVIFAHPRAGALSLALVFGLFTLVYGVNMLIMGNRLRRDEHHTRVTGPPVDTVA